MMPFNKYQFGSEGDFQIMPTVIIRNVSRTVFRFSSKIILIRVMLFRYARADPDTFTTPLHCVVWIAEQLRIDNTLLIAR